mmetsp:Transcript_12639/g.18148  ORF Transcript_12639/g.18148 Transcript_12639/m.18148 type:complete len:181 (+) Transcript_12639:79-621(+)
MNDVGSHNQISPHFQPLVSGSILAPNLVVGARTSSFIDSIAYQRLLSDPMACGVSRNRLLTTNPSLTVEVAAENPLLATLAVNSAASLSSAATNTLLSVAGTCAALQNSTAGALLFFKQQQRQLMEEHRKQKLILQERQESRQQKNEQHVVRQHQQAFHQQKRLARLKGAGFVLKNVLER